MNYNPEALKAQVQPKEGDRVSGRITKIEKGVIIDFVKPEVAALWKDTEPDDFAIQVTVEASNGSFLKRRVFKYPADNMVSPRSNLAKWKKIYGQYPFEGQLVELVADDEGYYQFLF